MQLLDFITLDNKSYNELSEAKRAKIDLFIERISENNLEIRLLQFNNRKYDVSEQAEGSQYKEIHETNLPEDMAKELDKIWVNLKN